MSQNKNTTLNSNTNVSKRSSRILAIDPGTKTMGYADFDNDKLVDYGLRFFEPCRKIEELLDSIERVIERLIKDKNPEIFVLEKNRFSQITNNIRLTMALMRIKSLAKRRNLVVVEYAPKTIRAIITKNGYATKSDTAKVIISKFPEIGHMFRRQSPSSLNRFYNITDAIACGQAYIELHLSERG